MTLLRAYLSVFLVVLIAYTLVVVGEHGPNLFPDFFGDIAKLSWAGQFNLDFMGFLSLSGLWLAWRHHFTAGGLVLGVVGFFGGMAVLAPYLVIVSLQANNDVATVLLGPTRAAALRSQLG